MKHSISISLDAHFGKPSQGATQVFLSSFIKGLRDCRAATHRDIETGVATPGMNHDSWVGALGYLAILDQIGTCFRLKGATETEAVAKNPIVSALRSFTDLSDDEIAAIYALRCAFAHDFSLFNAHPTKPALTHCFRLLGTSEGKLVTLPTKHWSGDYACRPSECWTTIDLLLLGDLVEEISARLAELARAGGLAIKLAGGPTELIDRYSLMNVLPAPSSP